MALTSCSQPVAIAPPPPPAPPPQVAPQLLDAFSASDKAWAYADGRALRQVVLPDLLQAASALRADVQVGLAAAATQCGFQPLLSVDEMLLRVRWAGERVEAWAAVLRMQESLDSCVRCLSAVAPDTRETALDGRRAWMLPGGFVVWNDGLFVVANSAAEAQVTIARMAQPEPAVQQLRAALAGAILSLHMVQPNPFGMDELATRWASQAMGSRLQVHAKFAGDTSAKQAETIVKDGLLQILGSNASFDTGSQGAADRFVQGASVNRNASNLDVTFDMPPLAGQTSLVSRIVSVAVRGVRQHTAWDLSGEARETVFVIARALVQYATRTRVPGKHPKFPPSAPLVPDDIPYGKRVTPNPHSFSHPSWRDIGFTSDKPTFYACDFLTSKDGRSVVVRARGDIDGDGTTSLFELDVRLDARDTPVIAPLIRERDPAE
jgi:hypothetical protein